MSETPSKVDSLDQPVVNPGESIETPLEVSPDIGPTETREVSSSLSRFHWRGEGSDIYSIRGLQEPSDPEPTPAAEPPPAAPVAEVAVRLEELEPDGGDETVRRRRARARYLASF